MEFPNKNQAKKFWGIHKLAFADFNPENKKFEFVMNSAPRLCKCLLILFILMITSCSPITASQSSNIDMAEDITPAETRIPTKTKVPSQTPSLTATQTATATLTATATVTATRFPTKTSSPTTTPEPTDTPIPISAQSSGISIYLVHLLGDGTDPCQANLVPVSTGLVATGDVKQDVKTAVNALFSLGVKYSGVLFNPLFQSNLRVSDLEYKKSDNDITVYLTGSFAKPKTDCEKKLYRNQVWDTIRQFPEVKRAHVWVGNLKLGDLLAVDY